MDSISLNVTTDPQPLRSNPKEQPTPAKTAKKKYSGTSNGFSFDFGGGGQKVKAVVARRRPAAKASASAPATPVASAAQKISKSTAMQRRKSLPNRINTEQSQESPKRGPLAHKYVTNAVDFEQQRAPESSQPRRKSVALKRNSDAHPKKTPSKGEQQAPTCVPGVKSSAKTPNQSEDLLLNVFIEANAESKQQSAKPKLTHAERIQQKRMLRKGNRVQSKRTFTEEEINEGIRKFSENPNKKPRAIDLASKEGNPCGARKTETQKTEANEVPEETQLDSHGSKAPKSNVGGKHSDESSVKKVDLFTNNPASKALGQRLIKPIRERIFDGTKVESLPLHPHCIKNLADLLSITELTTVQKKTIPEALQGKDILVRSQTGSGKTLAYALPVVEKLQEIRPKITRDIGILAVIIVPTRELAIQTYELFQKLLKPFTWIVAGVLMGGERRKAEKARLRKGINVLVGTPGRLVDHLLHTESFKLSKAKFLVLDEADRMLEMGYERDVKQIVEAMGKQRQELAIESQEEPPHLQRLLLSATLTAAVQKLAGLTLQNPIFIDNSDEDPSKAIKTPSSIGYSKQTIEDVMADALGSEEAGILTIPYNLQLHYVVVPPKLRLVTLSGLLAKEFVGRERLKAIVFMSTMEMVNFHHDLLNEQLTRKILDEEDEEAAAAAEEENADAEEALLKGLRFFKLHGSMTQTERQGVFKGFRECKSGVLLATDVVERGIDVPDIDLVVQYSPPQKIADFVHRVGRTARAGRSGRAVLFLAPSETLFVRSLEDKRIRISQVDMDVYLQALLDADDGANTVQEAASNLQHKFEELIADDRELHDKACKAFVSWMKFYTTFPRELKPVFNIRNAHMGHFAKSFGLKEQPTAFAKQHSAPKPLPPTNRLTYTERDPVKIKREKQTKRRLYATTVTGERRNRNIPPRGADNKLLKMLPTSVMLNTSEFDSGLPSKKKRKAK